MYSKDMEIYENQTPSQTSKIFSKPIKKFSIFTSKHLCQGLDLKSDNEKRYSSLHAQGI